MRFRRPQRKGLAKLPRLPLVAFIDVVLFLLLYFLMGSQFAAPESRLEAALRTESKGGSSGSDLVPLVLRVTNEKGTITYTLGERVMTDRAALSLVCTQMPKGGGIVVRLASDAPVWAAALALQVARDAGFEKVSYVPAS
ncbi:MAG: biopolymer transporter ExbD [Phycisphaerales bacterium]|nr:biopolymer transporter ExbD [Phycisphaerales bacterium]